ncbi:MAG: hypothetical protein KBA54_01025 [Candidatus Cloacimonetes bacterium]|nr:hypothetical protein [Candidatus Cloacimonadota bacterium]
MLVSNVPASIDFSRSGYSLLNEDHADYGGLLIYFTPEIRVIRVPFAFPRPIILWATVPKKQAISIQPLAFLLLQLSIRNKYGINTDFIRIDSVFIPY